MGLFITGYGLTLIVCFADSWVIVRAGAGGRIIFDPVNSDEFSFLVRYLRTVEVFVQSVP